MGVHELLKRRAVVSITRAAESAATLTKAGRAFDRVILARRGDAIFFLKGADFREMGEEFELGQNPVYLLRTLPEKLFRPADGSAAFATWEGGVLGVPMRQMQDLADAGQTWLGHGDKERAP